MWPGSSPSAVVNGAAGMIIAALLVAALYAGRDLLMSLALAGLLGFILAPLVRRLTNWGLPNGRCPGDCLASGLTVCRGDGRGPPAHAIARRPARSRGEPAGQGPFRAFRVGRERNLAASRRDGAQDRRGGARSKGGQAAKNRGRAGANDSLAAIFEYTRMSAPSLMSAVLVLLLTIFMLLQYRDLRDRMVRLMGTAEMGRSTQAFDEASANLAHYLLLQSGVNASFGVFVALSLWAIGIPSPVLWGVTTAVLRFVPYVGVLLSAAFPMALAAMIDPGWWKLVETAAVFMVGDPLLSQFVEPLLFGHQTPSALRSAIIPRRGRVFLVFREW
jgi:predicted PurR-regulated permease PerM